MHTELNDAHCYSELCKDFVDDDCFSKVSDSFSKVNTYTTKYLLVFGVRESMTILEFKALCIDINLQWLSSCSAVREKEHIRVKLTRKAWQILDKLTVKILSKYMCHVFNWRCVLDCAVSDRPKKFLPAQIPLSNRFDILSCDDLEESRSEFDEVSLSITNIKKLNATHRRFRLGSWNVQGLNCTRKQVEIGEILHKNNIDLLAVQESWEVTGKPKFLVPGYTWFGKPRSKESCKNLK